MKADQAGEREAFRALERELERAGYRHPGLTEISPLAGDGSDRRFDRCRFADGSTVLVVRPGGQSPQELAEARAAAAIGRHLAQAGVPVPTIYGFVKETGESGESGLLVLEDLGDTLLYHRLQAKPPAAEVTAIYRQALNALLSLQVDARPGFPLAHCWDTPRYDRQLMLERESGYFYRALARDLLGHGEMPAALAAEFEALADRAAAEPADFVLHRDYQCRNLMLQNGKVRLIDFQGARLGPLGYDLASLLYDPYAGLPPELREELLAYYLQQAAGKIPDFNRRAFRQGWYYLALQRHLQILGAFAFLSRQKGKMFFAAFIKPAARQLAELLASDQGQNFPTLQNLAKTINH